MHAVAVPPRKERRRLKSVMQSMVFMVVSGERGAWVQRQAWCKKEKKGQRARDLAQPSLQNNTSSETTAYRHTHIHARDASPAVRQAPAPCAVSWSCVLSGSRVGARCATRQPRTHRARCRCAYALGVLLKKRKMAPYHSRKLVDTTGGSLSGNACATAR